MVTGQDGQHTGTDLLASPTNTSVPGNVDSALYYMSEHLPVTLKLGINYTVYAGIKESADATDLQINYNSIATNVLTISTAKSKNQPLLNNCQAMIYDLQGRCLSVHYLDLNQAASIDVSSLSSGMYILKIMNDGTPIYIGKFVKE